MPFSINRIHRAARCLCLFVLILASWSARADLWVTGYYPGYRHGAMSPSSVDFTALTHVIDFSAIPREDGSLDLTSNGMNATRSAALISAAKAVDRKVLFSVGPKGGSVFTNAASVANLPTFINNLTNLLVTRGYDGIDIDWEPIKPADAERFNAFVIALRSALDTFTPRPLLTIAVYTEPSIVAAMHSYFDQINIMTYGMSGTYPGWITWHNSPLFNGGITFPSVRNKFVPSIDATVASFIDAGVPPEKLGIGISFFGLVWQGGTGTPTGGATQPAQSYLTDPDTFSRGFNQIMNDYFHPDYYRWDTNAQAAYLSIDKPGSAEDMFISYDDERTCQVKVSYARNRGLGGVMIWELGQGYRSNLPVGQREPLLQTIKAAMNTPRVTEIDRAGNTVTFRFTSLPLATYRIQWTSDLISGVWNTLTNDIPGTGDIIEVSDTVGTDQRFYRVQTP